MSLIDPSKLRNGINIHSFSFGIRKLQGIVAYLCLNLIMILYRIMNHFLFMMLIKNIYCIMVPNNGHESNLVFIQSFLTFESFNTSIYPVPLWQVSVSTRRTYFQRLRFIHQIRECKNTFIPFLLITLYYQFRSRKKLPSLTSKHDKKCFAI